MIRRPPRSTLFLHDALPISRTVERRVVEGATAIARVAVPVAPCRAHVDRTEAGADRSIDGVDEDRKSTRLNSSHLVISYAVFCLKKKKQSALTAASATRLRR